MSAPEGVTSGGASPASVSAPAPAAPATEAPIASATEAPTSSAPAVSEAPKATPTQEVSPFDWKAWDGNVDKVPETWRDPVRNASEYFQSKYKDYDDYKSRAQELMDENERIDRLYQTALANFTNDPRISALEKERETYQSQVNEWQGKYQEMEAQLQEWVQSDAKSYADNLTRTYPKYFSDDAARAQLSGMMEKGWDPEIAIQLLEMGESAIARADEAKAEGASDSLALKFAKAGTVERPKPQRREAAQVMAGAEPASTPARAVMSMQDASSQEERIRLAATRALKLHAGGR